MKRAPSSAIVARALTDVAAKDLPLCNTATDFAAPLFPPQQNQQSCAIQVDRQTGCEHSTVHCSIQADMQQTLECTVLCSLCSKLPR